MNGRHFFVAALLLLSPLLFLQCCLADDEDGRNYYDGGGSMPFILNPALAVNGQKTKTHQVYLSFLCYLFLISSVSVSRFPRNS